MKNIEFSIVMSVLNEERRIKKALDAIAQQEGTTFEVIVVDNGCSDNSIEIALQYPFVKVIRYLGKLGGAKQEGLMMAKGQYTIFIDADEQIPQGTLIKVKNVISNLNNCDAIIARIKPFCVFKSIWERYIKAYFLGDTLKSNLWKYLTFHSGGLVVRTDIARRVKFDPKMPISEDGDFSYRFLKLGYRSYYVRNYVVIDEIYSDFLGFYSYYRKLGIAGLLLFKKYPSLEMLKYQIKILAEPFTPHYLVIRYRKIRKYFKNFILWVLIGALRTKFMVLSWIIYGILGKSIPSKVTRYKA